MKTFECFWGDGYRANDNKSIMAYHDQDFFTEDRGYDKIDIVGINGLNIDEVCKFKESGDHWVRRIS